VGTAKGEVAGFGASAVTLSPHAPAIERSEAVL